MLRYVLVLVGWLIGLCHGAGAQSGGGAVDSLRDRLEQWQRAGASGASDTLGLNLMNALATAYHHAGRPDSSLVWAVRTSTKAMEALSTLPTDSQSDVRKQLMDAQRIQAMGLFFLNRYPECVDRLQEYLASAEQLGRANDIGAAYNYMAFCYDAMDDLPTALRWSRRSVQILKDKPDGIDMANAYVGLANILYGLAQEDSAVLYYREAVRLHEHLDQPANRTSAMFMLAEIFLRQERLDSLDRYMGLIAKSMEGVSSERSEMRYTLFQGRMAMEHGDARGALLLFTRADSLAVSMEDHRQRHYIHQNWSIASASLGDVHGAFRHAEIAAEELKLDMGLEKMRALTAKGSAMAYEQELKAASDQVEEQRRNTRLALAGSGALLLIVGLLLLLYRHSQRSTRQAKASNKALIEAQERLVAAEKQHEAESVRTRIARDIHDELGGSLAKIALLSDHLRTGGSAKEEGVLSLFTLAEQAREVKASLNDVVWTVDPTHDSALALLDRVADTARRILDSADIELCLDLGAADPTRVLSPEVKHHIHLIVKEALTNALKHAEARRVAVTVELGAENYFLRVSDDGRGMQAAEGNGQGLSNMRSRARAIGATILVAPAAGGGTLVEVRGPMPPSA